ncbi:MAG: MFS transporter [Acidobacteriia bacterium]|nr:MFS transporter [Terriglobia bacterium]
MTEPKTPGQARPQPSRLYRWLVLIFISLAMFGNYYVYDALSPVADLLNRQLGFPQTYIGLLQGIYSFPNIFTVLIGGVIIDRIGLRKSTLIFGVLCFIGAFVTVISPPRFVAAIAPGVAGTVAAPFSWFSQSTGDYIRTALSNDRLLVMAFGRLIFGMGAESLIVAVTAALAKWFRGKELSFAFGVNLMIARLGSFAALNSPTWAQGAYSNWRTPFLIGVGFCTFCITGAVVYWVMELYAEKHYELGHASTDKVVFRDLFSFGTSYWYVVALCITFYSAIFPFQTFAVEFFQDAHGTSRAFGGFLSSMLTLFAMFATPLFGLLVDKVGKRALFMMFGSLLLIPVYLIMGYTHVSLYVPMAMMGIAFSLIPAVMWPSVAYIVEQSKLGTAYGLMTMIQNIGLFGFNLLVGWANDYGGASAQNPAGYRLGMQIFSVLGFLGMLFAFLLRQRETGPHGHGLETITTATGA